ncbi:MAG TPA: hypothetical protein VKU39_00595, partial [Streptosporangiaceae bacterium]|nr:hypothetical protein [Streptosporangiaceae bacterium]
MTDAPQVVTLPQLVTVPDVEIVAAGTWNLSTGQATFTAEDLAAAVQAAQCPAVGSPILKLGHIDPRFDGEPAVGRVAAMRLTSGGAKINADLAGMPAWLAAALPSAYPNRSIEGIYGYQCQIGHKHPFVITGLALLGVEKPGVGVLSSLKDVAALYGVAASAGDEGSAWKLRFGDVMADASPSAATTVEDIRRAYYDSKDTPPTYWITEIQLSPLQMIVADEAEGCLYRVPVKIDADGKPAFGEAVAVQVSYVDAPTDEKTTASAASPVGRALAVAAKLRGQADDQLRELADMRVAAGWNGPQQVKNLGTDPTATQIKALFAIPAGTKSESKLPHHDVSSDGTVGEANVDGVEAALAALNGSQGGVKDVTDEQRQTAYNHLASHYKDAGKTAPPLQASGGQPDTGQPVTDDQNPAGEGPKNSGPVHGQFVGTHSHPHSAYGSQGGDMTHEHEHTHSGDAQHDHHGTATSASSMTPTTRGAADMQFSDTELAAVRQKLGKGDGDEVTPGEVLAALGIQASAPAVPAAPVPQAQPPAPVAPHVQAGALPPGLMLVDQGAWDDMQRRLQMGEQARREQLTARRDQVIQAAIMAGKTPPSRREHWQKLWDTDPDGTEQVLASLSAGLIPLGDIG